MGQTLDSGVAGRPRKVGVLGGTFDPVHNGHIAIAEAVRSELDLDEVLFVVAADQWLRENPPAAAASDRLAMVELAVDGRMGFEASDVDIVRTGATYTVDTLTDLREQFDEAIEMHLIVGADSATLMDRWNRAGTIVSLARVTVIGRPGMEFDEGSLEKSHPASGAVYVEGPMIDVSATAIRDLVRAGKPLTGLVPDPVANYIEANGLYR
ncbi:MAG: nicotinate-nucleotide adenylyltransferase [Chloroflexi bacterium]|nr:nicotinate-nucleotide adenylyltransferase [Chloroflexota bacterium]